MNFQNNQIIFNQGDSADCAYLLENGEVQIFLLDEKNERKILRTLHTGDIFGEMALIDHSFRSTSAVALNDVQLLRLSREQIMDKIHESDDLVQFLIKALVKNIKNQELHFFDHKINTEVHQKSPNKKNIKVLENLKNESQIIRALNQEEFIMYHQPIVRLSDHKIMGSEALVRWEKSTEILPPSHFIQYIESSSLAFPFGCWVIENCFSHYKKMKATHEEFSISINISSKQLKHPEFLLNMDSLINQYQINPANFKIEIIERFLTEGETAVQLLQELKKRGFQISIDDFGTGYSGLQYLARLPIDYLKIDRSFVIESAKNDKTILILKSIIYLAKQLKLKIITEGLETESEVKLLTELGSDYGQGYYFSKPVSLQEFLKLL